MPADAQPRDKVLAVVPPRARSKGFPGKDVAMLDERPLYQHGMGRALGDGVDLVVVTARPQSAEGVV